MKNLFYKAVLKALPEKWNSHNYVVETEAVNSIHRTLYFSESAPGKPINVPIGTEGFVVCKEPGIFYWQESCPPLRSEVDDDKEDSEIGNWFAL